MGSLVYSTLRIVSIPNRCLGATYIILTIAVIIYIGGFGLFWSKGYQAICPVESVVVTKVKGVVYTDFTDQQLNVPFPEFYRRIWDASDISTPSHGEESGGFFILTDIVITPNQTREVCAEDPKVVGAICRTEKDCPPGKALKLGNGVTTGKCIMKDKSTKTCEIRSWCPVEESRRPLGDKTALLLGTQDFTVLIKNSIEFPAFGKRYSRRNIMNSATPEHLQTCTYNAKTDPYCPTFRIGDIVTGAGEKYEDVAVSGAVIALKIEWFCDFDWGRTINDCRPKYSFARMDNPKAAVSPGFNFRSAVYHEENRRTLTQNFGIKIVISVEGEGRMFDSVKLLLTIGAGVGLFGVVTIICDLVFSILCLLKGYLNWHWLQFYNEEMKYDLSHIKAKEEHRNMRNRAPVEDPDGIQLDSKVNLRSPH